MMVMFFDLYELILPLVPICVVVLLFILVGEAIARKYPAKPEYARKFVHISVGTFAATWPLYLSWTQIVLMGVAFIVIEFVFKKLKIFKSLGGIKRKSLGDLYFGLAIVLVALISQNVWIYMAAILHMSLADGFAAVFGTKFGKKNNYTVFGTTKSLVGSFVLLAISLIILAGYVYFSGYAGDRWPLLGLAMAAVLLENISIKGLDNITVPLLVTFVLSNL